MKLKRDVDSWPPPPSMSKTVPHDEAKELIVKMAKAASVPLLIGVASIKLGYFWSIERTEELFVELVLEKRLREVTTEEKEVHGLQDGYVAVV